MNNNHRRANRNWHRKARGKRPDGLLVRKYSPELWQEARRMYDADRTLSIADVARAVGMSYKMTWKVVRGKTKDGRMPTKDAR